MKKEFDVQEQTYKESRTKTVGSADYYTLLFIIAGKCTCQYERQTYPCTTEDMVLITPGHKAELLYTESKVPLRFLQMRFSENLLSRLSNEQTDLTSSFHRTPYACTCIHSPSDTAMMIKHLAGRLLSSAQEADSFAHQLFQDSLLTMLFILILRACIKEDRIFRRKIRSRLSLDDIFMYIRLHLQEEITLDMLEKEFFISKYHIAREFKKQTGITVHRYITKSRLDLCRKLLEEGYPVIEIHKVCGIGSYNHLFRAFKQEFGMTPKEYLKMKNNSTSIPH